MTETGLMEKTWERIQTKTFTKWVNSHLRKRRLVIEDLKTGFNDGIVLIQFLEIISGQTLPKYEKKPRHRIQKVGNISTALQFLKSQKIQLVNIAAEDIVDENLKLILGLIWTIIQKFAIDDISEEQLSAKEALLLWCQKKTAGYRDVKVDNFHYSFQDGLALCALIHKHRPDLIDFNKLDKNNKAQNLQLAFDVAERDLGIPKLLDVEDMVDIKPDERSVMTYVSQYYHVFSKYNQAEVAGRRIGKLVDLTEALDSMKNDYGDKAKKLVEWIDHTTPLIEERNFDNSLDGVRQKIEDQKHYKTDVKPPKAADKASVDALFNNIALKLRSNNRPAFVAPVGLSPSDIDQKWDYLSQAERDRDQALRDELRRQERIQFLKRRFDLKAGKLEDWLAAKEHYVGTVESVNSLNEAQTSLKNHDAFDQEYHHSKPRLDAVQALAEEYASLNPPDSEAVAQKSHELASRWTGLSGPQAAKRQDLEDKLAKEQKKEELRLEFAKLAKEYGVWNKERTNEATDHNFGDSLEAVRDYHSQLQQRETNDTQHSSTKKEALDQLYDELQALGATENRYTPLTNKDIAAQHNNLLDLLAKRKTAYDLELQRQINLDEKRKEFAAKAQEFVESLNNRKSDINNLALSGSPAETIDAINSVFQDGKHEQDSLKHLNALQEELFALGARDNKYTQYTIPVLQTQNQKFVNSVRNTLSSLKDEQELKEEYVSKAQALVDWAHQALPNIQKRDFDNTLQGAVAQHTEWQKFITGEKGTKDIEKINLDSLFHKISGILGAAKRPEFHLDAPLNPASVNELWQQLNQEEKSKDAAIKDELHRQEKLATLVKRFNSDAEDLLTWFHEKDAYVKAQEDVQDLDSARLKNKILEVFKSEFEAKNVPFEALKQLNKEIAENRYHQIEAIEATTAKIQHHFDEFSSLINQKDKHLQEALSTQQAHEDLRVAFAESAKDLSRFIRDAVETASDHNFGFTLEDVTQHRSELDSSDNHLTERADSLKTKAEQLANDLSSRGVSDNRHTSHTSADVSSLRSQLDEALHKRRSAYDAELHRQTVNEDKRKAYAEKANGFISFVDSQKNSLQALSGEPEERISSTEQLYQGGVPANNQVEELTHLDKELKQLGVFDNRHTPYSLPVVETRKQQYDTSIHNFISGLNEEKALNERAAALQAEYETALRKENLRIRYATEANALHLWLETTNETLSDPIACDSVSDAQNLQHALEAIRSEQPAYQGRYDSLVGLSQEVSDEGIDTGKVPTISDLTQKWNQFQTDLESRNQAIHAELERQNSNESLRVKFADSAKQLNSLIQEKFAALNQHVAGELEDQLSHVQALRPQIIGAQAQLNELETLHLALQEAQVFHNSHTDLNFPTLKTNYDQLVKAVSAKEALIQKEIITKSNQNVSPQQLAEFKEVFEHFDKDKNNSLSRLEFKSCLQSLGEDLSDSELDGLIQNIGTNGRVAFEEFVTFMSNKAADSDTQSQILDAFRALAGDAQFVTEDQLRRALPSEKVDYLVKHMPLYKDTAGSYDYVAWAQSAFN